ncbi:MAG: preprotein translocase subunit SecG [Pseudomonadota bacterium]
MEQIILIAHLLIALAIIGLILLQQGKGAEMGASFGAGASQTLFGSAGGSNVLTRATALLAAAFFVTSFGLAIVAKDKASAGSDLTIELPTSAEEAMPVMESDLPLLDSELASDPQALDDIPSAQSDSPADISGDDMPPLPETE